MPVFIIWFIIIVIGLIKASLTVLISLVDKPLNPKFVLEANLSNTWLTVSSLTISYISGGLSDKKHLALILINNGW